ncbi:hypothetical protein BDY19DRAFT_151172 [Irpex rosettiformis]|uniref:Uncharacterized protein n=1 Tax=Irpex rosettiformis TaxID=378272 RepID=A0ACB8U3S2_9APHY|nr:hypothetical protein BDY19DRAFT_151172 [Irpex rosettiformis]
MPTFDLEKFIGPAFIVICISFILYGLGLAQVYFYFRTYHDHPAIKLLVILVCILETLHVAFCIHMVYTYLIIDFADPGSVLNIIWSTGASIFLEIIISGLVQSYYIYRIRCLCKSGYVFVYLISVVCARIAFGFRATAYGYPVTTWEAMSALRSYKICVNVSLVFNVVADSSITFVLIFYLHQSHVSARVRSTRNILYKLMYYSLSAGVLTTLTSVIALILFHVSKTTIAFIGVLEVMTKVYANSMLAMLNIRQGLKLEREIAVNNGLSLRLTDVSKQVIVQPDVRMLFTPSSNTSIY